MTAFLERDTAALAAEGGFDGMPESERRGSGRLSGRDELSEVRQ
jgi:hypothetical protein